MDIEAGPRLMVALDPYWRNYNFREQEIWFRKGIEACRGGAAISPSIQARLLGSCAWIFEKDDPQLPGDMLQKSLALLKINPHTRQALMTMYSTEKDLMNWNGRDRVPCSVSYHFLVRENKLNLIYYQRSCDFITFLLPDVYFSCSLLFHISEKTGIPQGEFIHFISSLHAFHKDLKDRNIF